MLYGSNIDRAREIFSEAPKELLVDILEEIYYAIFCDCDDLADTVGDFDPENSIASDSAADAVEFIGMVFHRLPSLLENKND